MDDAIILILLFGGISGLLFLVSFACATLIQLLDMKGLNKTMKYSWITAFIFLSITIILYYLFKD